MVQQIEIPNIASERGKPKLSGVQIKAGVDQQGAVHFDAVGESAEAPSKHARRAEDIRCRRIQAERCNVFQHALHLFEGAKESAIRLLEGSKFGDMLETGAEKEVEAGA